MSEPIEEQKVRTQDELNEVVLNVFKVTTAAGLTIEDGIECFSRVLMSLMLEVNDNDQEAAARDIETLCRQMAAAMRDPGTQVTHAVTDGEMVQ